MNPSMLISVTFGCAVFGWLMGCGAALIWTHPLLSFGVFLILALVSLRLHAPHGRVVGVAVDAVRVTVS